MPESVSYRIKADGGHIVPDSPKAMRAFLQAKDGKIMRLSLEEWKEVRSPAQGRAWWGIVVKAFCEYMGYRFNSKRDRDYVHEQVLIAIGHCENVKGFDGQIKERALPTHRLKTDEFSDLYKRAQEFGAGIDVMIPDQGSTEAIAMIGNTSRKRVA